MLTEMAILRFAAFASLLAALSGSTSVPAARATVLYNDRVVTLDRIGVDPGHSPDALWVRTIDLPRINDFELKPQGACRADVCVPVTKEMTRGTFFNLTAFARVVGQPVVVDRSARVWSFGEIPLVRGASLESRAAPDFAVPDRAGRIVHLADFRGKKVLVLTWASW